MSISVYSVFTAFLWFNLFILILSFLRRSLGVLLNYQLSPLIFAIVLSLVRLFVPFEPSFSVVVRSKYFLPSVLHILRTEYISLGTVSISLEIMIVLIIPLVSCFLLLRYIYLLFKAQKKKDNQPPAEDPRLCAIFEQVKRDCPSDRECGLRVLGGDFCPYIFCFKRAFIVLPDWIYTLPDEWIYFILRHERQHLLNNDCTIKLWMQGLCNLLWWNPLIFLLKMDIDQTLELKCDKKVIENMTEAEVAEYLFCIVKLAARYQSKEVLKDIPTGAIPLLGKSFRALRSPEKDPCFRQRYNFIESSPNKAKRKIGAVCITCLMLLFMGSFCFTVQPFITPSETDIPSDLISYGLIEITPETARLLDNQDGTYSLFVNGECWYDVPADRLSYEPYNSLTITY